MARPKTPDGKRVTVATKLSEPTAAAMDAARGPVTRSEWLSDAITGTLDGYRHERKERCHHSACHKLSCDEYDALRARARACCEICGTPEAETRRGLLVIDHYEDAAVRYVRGLLCDQCNQVMSCHDGHKPWGTNRQWQAKAAEYASRAFQEPFKISRERKVLITYRVDADLLAAVAAKAASRGETVADVITRGLEAYVRGETAGGAVMRRPALPSPPRAAQAPPAPVAPLEEPASCEEPAPCRHPAAQVEAGECRSCGADVW